MFAYNRIKANSRLIHVYLQVHTGELIMSADNGVYILVTPKGNDKEYRVAYHMAVENVYWDDQKKEESQDPDVHIRNAREMWKNAEVFTDKTEALVHAHNMAEDFPILEYGVSSIHIDREF